MLDRLRCTLVALLLLFLLLAARDRIPSGWAAAPSVGFWRVLLPLGGSPGVDQAPQAFQQAERLGGVLGKILLHRKMDPELAEALGIILRRSQDLDLKGLYAHQALPWREGPGGQRSLAYQGRVEGKGYYLSLISRPPSLLAPGDMVSKLALSPLGPRPQRVEGDSFRSGDSLASRRGFLLQFEHDLHTGPLGIAEEMAMGEGLLSLLDASPQSSLADGQGPREAASGGLYLKELFRISFPHLTSLFGRYLKVADVAQVYRDPLLDEPVTRMDLMIRVREEILRRHYPYFYQAYEKLIHSSASVLQVKDSSGHLVGEVVRDGGQLSVRFLTRRGLLYPADGRWQVADPRGLSIHRLRQLPHVIELSAWLRVLGMKVGMQRLSFRNAYRDGISTWSLSEVPELILPWGIKQLFSPFLRPFLEYLRSGEDGRGLTYQLAFRPAGEGYVHQARLSLPLRDSPLLSFLLRLGGDLGHSLSPQAQQELHRLLAETIRALSQDYQQARVKLLLPFPSR